MAIQLIGLGTAANDGTGDNARTAGAKMNSMFTELYTRRRQMIGSALGDSITAQNVNSGAGLYNNGYMHWLDRLTAKRFVIYPGHIKGVGGENSTQILARVGDIIALSPKPDFCVVPGPTNDLAGISPKLAIDNMLSIYRALLNAGILPITIALMPRNETDAADQQLQGYNNFMHALANGRSDIVAYANLPALPLFCNPYRKMFDYTDAAFGALASMTQDGLHWSQIGAFTVGSDLADLMNATFPGFQEEFHGSPNDAYHATLNPGGNLCDSNTSWMGGTTGTKTASTGMTISGSVATGCTFRRQVGTSTSTVVCAKEANPDSSNANWQRFTIDITGAAGTYDEYQFFTTALVNPAVNDVIVAECRYKILNTSTKVRSIQLASSSHPAPDGMDTGQDFPDDAHSGVLRTTPFTVTSAISRSANCSMFVKSDTIGGHLDIAFSTLTLRKINTP